jgi:threonine synthase
MRYYSTKNKSAFYSLRDAVLKGLPDDGGLFMPESIPVLPKDFINQISQLSLSEIAENISRQFFADNLPQQIISDIANKSIIFDAPLKRLDDRKYVLELFHGPTLAFKDFGARFMAQLMSYFVRDEKSKLTILVATSGDTGSAVASGFLGVQGIEVIILYPSGKVSGLQEKQLTTARQNITALEIQGTFDDCQQLVKTAFPDAEIASKFKLTSANSINIARLIPQSFYYFYAYGKLSGSKDPIVFSVPSGNFGNLTAGLIAKRMGLPVHHFIAATNINDIVPAYLSGGMFSSQSSKQTISNAMDVGNPSNFQRMLDLYGGSCEKMKRDITGYSFDDDMTAQAMKELQSEYKYIADPHGAVGYLGLSAYQKEHPNTKGIFLETAHPAKFANVVKRILNIDVELPPQLMGLEHKQKQAQLMPSDYSVFKEYLMGRS